MTHIYVSKLSIISSDNGLSPGRRQAIIWTDTGILTLGNKRQWNHNRNLYIIIQENAFENVVREIGDHLSQPRCLNVCMLHVAFVINVFAKY